MADALAPVNTVVYGGLSQESRMADQLSARDWLDRGLKVLAESGFTALKAEPLAREIRATAPAIKVLFTFQFLIKLLRRAMRKSYLRVFPES